ncbi:ATP-binding protein [Rarobacter incanus]|uniref:ATP-binding protein n=1 Tax=Rarobacter incanus TaxID=153494 RepID=UPI001151440F|nr:ATP-binding protein [Rarobacter incanus]
MPVQSSPKAPTTRLPLRRIERGRIAAGVCRGLAAHLDQPVQRIRLAMIGLAVFGGVGVVLYLFLWLTVPVGDPALDARQGADLQRARGARELVERVAASRWQGVSVANAAVGVLLVVIAVMLIGRPVPERLAQWLLPVFIVAAGALLTWSQLDQSQRQRFLGNTDAATGRWGAVRFVAGIALVIAGVLAFVGRGSSPAVALGGAVAAIAVLAGVALVLAPWWLRLLRDLAQERAARERADERADIAAHLHDSVLQTLALIQRNAGDGVLVGKLARTQERELRGWLYRDEAPSGTSVAAEIRGVCEEIEDEFAVAVDLVTVGDTAPDARSGALLQATGEALKNAVRHGKPPVTVYFEAAPTHLEVSVQDRGEGFDVDAIAQDRFGVRQSIVGRIERRGGNVLIRQRGDGGTEVRMSIPRGEEAEGE